MYFFLLFLNAFLAMLNTYNAINMISIRKTGFASICLFCAVVSAIAFFKMLNL